MPALTATITGYVNGQTPATSGVTGSPACTTTATATSAGGTYPITCSIGTLAAVNYTFAFVPGTLTVTFTTTVVCDHLGSIVVTSGESVLIPPGCVQLGNISVQTNGSLEIEGAIVVGSIGFSSGADLEVCSTNLAGSLSATLAATRVVVGNDSSACLGNAMIGSVSLNSNSAGVTFDGNLGAGSVTVNANSSGVQGIGQCLAGTGAGGEEQRGSDRDVQRDPRLADRQWQHRVRLRRRQCRDRFQSRFSNARRTDPHTARSARGAPEQGSEGDALAFLPFELGHGGVPAVGDPVPAEDNQRCLQQNA